MIEGEVDPLLETRCFAANRDQVVGKTADDDDHFRPDQFCYSLHEKMMLDSRGEGHFDGEEDAEHHGPHLRLGQIDRNDGRVV